MAKTSVGRVHAFEVGVAAGLPVHHRLAEAPQLVEHASGNGSTGTPCCSRSGERLRVGRLELRIIQAFAACAAVCMMRLGSARRDTPACKLMIISSAGPAPPAAGGNRTWRRDAAPFHKCRSRFVLPTRSARHGRQKYDQPNLACAIAGLGAARLTGMRCITRTPDCALPGLYRLTPAARIQPGAGRAEGHAWG